MHLHVTHLGEANLLGLHSGKNASRRDEGNFTYEALPRKKCFLAHMRLDLGQSLKRRLCCNQIVETSLRILPERSERTSVRLVLMECAAAQ